MSVSALAYLGDAIYEQAVRERIVLASDCVAEALFRRSLRYVAADAQAKAMEGIFEKLSEEEQVLCRRARNHTPHSRPRNQDPRDYRKATALEALCAWLYLQGKAERLKEILQLCFAILEA